MSSFSKPVSRRYMLFALLVCVLAVPVMLSRRHVFHVILAQKVIMIPQAVDNVDYCRVSPKGKYMVTWQGDIAYIWNLSTGLIENHIDGILGPDDAIFSPDGRYLIFTNQRFRYFSNIVWDMKQRVIIHVWDNIRFVSFTPNGKQVWTCRVKKYESYPRVPEQDVLELRDIVSGKVVRTASALTGQVLALSPDGTKVVINGQKGKAIVFAINNGVQLSQLPVLWLNVKFLFSPDNSTVISYDNYNRKDIYIWNSQTGMLMQNLHTNEIFDFATFSPDGRRLAASFQQKANYGHLQDKAVVWDVHSGRVLQTLTDLRLEVKVQAFTPDSKSLFTSNVVNNDIQITGQICRWDVATGSMNRIYEAPGKIRCPRDVAMTMDGKQLAIYDMQSIALWNMALGRIGKELALPANESILSMAFSPDGAMLVAGVSDNVKWGTSDNNFSSHIMVWDAATGAVKKDLPIPVKGCFIRGFGFTPDGTCMASAWAKTVAIINTADWKITQQFDMPEGFIGDNPVFSFDGRWLKLDNQGRKSRWLPQLHRFHFDVAGIVNRKDPRISYSRRCDSHYYGIQPGQPFTRGIIQRQERRKNHHF